MSNLQEKPYDIAIVGGGPGGYVAAIRARQLGLRTLLIEREALGGICLNWGCIPTKALLRTAELWRSLQKMEQFGLSVKAGSNFDSKRIVARSRAVAAKLNGGVEMLMKKNGVEVRYGNARLGTARLGGMGELVVAEAAGGKEEVIKAKHIILATGARARELPSVPIDGDSVWGYREAMVAENFPKRLLVAGGGAIGLEFASYFSAFGVEVIVVEAAERILLHEDEEVAAILKTYMEKEQGIKFLLGVSIESVAKQKAGNKGGGVVVKLGNGDTLEVDRVLSAVGVVGNVEGLGLEEAGVAFDSDRGVIGVDGLLRTNVEGIYAIGDVAGAPMLAHKASHEGVVCVESIAGEDVAPIVREHIPSCVYTSPQVASVGMSAQDAEREGCKVRIGRFPLGANGKAIAMGEEVGLVKVVFAEGSGAFLGASMVGNEVVEMVQGYGIALGMEATEAELMGTVFAHPTISEAMHEAVLDGWGRALHVPPRK